MKEKIKISLQYVTDDGELGKYDFEIVFISNSMIREFNEINTVVNKVAHSWMKHNKMMNSITNNSSKMTAEEITKITAEAEKEANEIKSINAFDFFKKRANLAIKILKRNGYKDESLPYLKEEFWDESVEPDVLNDFLKDCINKDLIGLKKKLPAGTLI